MKILFVYPHFKKYLETNPAILEALKFPLYASYKSTPSLGIPIMTALTPDEHEVHFADGNLDPIPYDEHFDLVVINCFTPQAKHAYEIGDTFRARGVKTVMGGILPTNYPEDAKKHCDAVCIGEAEQTYPQVLEDAKKGKLQEFYIGDNTFDMANYVMPDRRLFKNKKGYDWKPVLVQCFRGCDMRCNYCAIPGAHGNCIRMRPPEHVIKEIEMNMDMDGLFIADDQLLFPTEATEKYAYDFFTRLKDLNYKKSIFLSGSAMLTKDEKLLRLVKDAGVDHLYCVTGFDPISMKAVTHDMPEDAETNFKRMRDAGLEIFASVTMGLESDTKDIFEKHLKFLERNKIRFVEFWLATPYPGTPMWRKYKAKNRILTEDFDLYNGAHCVFQPKKMTKEEMEEGFLYCWKEFFTRFPLDPAEAMKYYNLTEEYQKKHGLIPNDDNATDK